MFKYCKKLNKTMKTPSFNFNMQNKKGSLVDPIFSGAYILKIAITILIAVFVWFSFQTLMADQIIGSPSESILTNVMNNLSASYLSMDYMFPFIVGGLLLVSTIFAFKTGANIIWAWISIIIWVIALLLSALFVNVYLTISDEFPTIYTQFPIMDVIMTNLHWFTLAWLAVITAVMFRKNNAEDDATSKIQGRFYGG